MLIFKRGDILKSKADVLVNPVNCVGVMGKGLAAQFKKIFPEVFKEYAKLCKRKILKPGKPYYCPSLFPHSVVLFPTKDHWRAKSKVTDIEQGLKKLRKNLVKWKISSIAVPALGCGLGGLDWKSDVRPLIEKYYSDVLIDVEVFEP